jgi:hypothetical protein
MVAKLNPLFENKRQSLRQLNVLLPKNTDVTELFLCLLLCCKFLFGILPTLSRCLVRLDVYLHNLVRRSLNRYGFL